MSLFLFFSFSSSLFSSLVFSSFLFLFLFLFLFFFSLSSSLFCLCLLSPCVGGVCVVVCVVVCVCVWCVCVVVLLCVVVCHAEKHPCVHSKRLRVNVQNVSVCTGTTRTCFSACARGADMHGDVLNLHTEAFSSLHTGGRRQFSLPKNHARRVITWPHRFTESNHWMLPMFKFEKRSRTTCSRFLQSFALPNKTVKLQLSWRNIGRTSREMVRIVFRSHEKSITNDLRVSIS